MTSTIERLAELSVEVERLTQCLKRANDQFEHFEREWYLRGDEIEVLRARVAELEGMVQKPFGPIKHPNACLVCGNIHGHGDLPCPSLQAMFESAV